MQIFRIFDINDDGSISIKELKKIVKDLFHLLKKDGDPEKESEVRTHNGTRTTFRMTCVYFVLIARHVPPADGRWDCRRHYRRYRIRT